MKVKAKRTEGGFLIPLLEGLENKDEIEVTIEIESEKQTILTDEYIEKNWGKILLNANRKPFIEDDEIIIDAYTEYRNEESSCRY